MSKGYSREIMEELFREEQKRQEKEHAIANEKKQRHRQQVEHANMELVYGRIQGLEDEIGRLNKRLNRMKIMVAVSIVASLIAIAIGFANPLTSMINYMP